MKNLQNDIEKIIAEQKENEKKAIKKYIRKGKYDEDFIIVYSDKVEMYKIDVYNCLVNFTSRKMSGEINEDRLKAIGYKLQ